MNLAIKVLGSILHRSKLQSVVLKFNSITRLFRSLFVGPSLKIQCPNSVYHKMCFEGNVHNKSVFRDHKTVFVISLFLSL